MPKTLAAIGHNAKFGIKSGATYTNVAEVTNITPPGWTRETVEATHLNSDDGYKEFIAGLKEGTEATLTINFVPTAADALLTAFETGAGDYRIVFPSGTVGLMFAGIVTAYEPGELVSTDKMTAALTIKATGKPTLAVVAP